jgi:hypothetical protein
MKGGGDVFDGRGLVMLERGGDGFGCVERDGDFEEILVVWLANWDLRWAVSRSLRCSELDLRPRQLFSKSTAINVHKTYYQDSCHRYEIRKLQASVVETP